MNLLEVREMLAADTSALVYEPAGPSTDAKHVRCTAHPVKGNLRLGDAWVVVDIGSPGDIQHEVAQTFIVYIVLGSDEAKAEKVADLLTVPFLNVGVEAAGFNITVRRMAIIAGEPQRPGQVYALALTLTKEITS